MSKFEVTIQKIKDEASSYSDDDGKPVALTDLEAKQALDSWNEMLPNYFYEHMKGFVCGELDGEFDEDWQVKFPWKIPIDIGELFQNLI